MLSFAAVAREPRNRMLQEKTRISASPSHYRWSVPGWEIVVRNGRLTP
jgi:hypothetical protein